MSDGCKAVLICKVDSNADLNQGDRCWQPCVPGSEFCWTHNLSITNGIRSKEKVLGGVGVGRRAS